MKASPQVATDSLTPQCHQTKSLGYLWSLIFATSHGSWRNLPAVRSSLMVGLIWLMSASGYKWFQWKSNDDSKNRKVKPCISNMPMKNKWELLSCWCCAFLARVVHSGNSIIFYISYILSHLLYRYLLSRMVWNLCCCSCACVGDQGYHGCLYWSLLIESIDYWIRFIGFVPLRYFPWVHAHLQTHASLRSRTMWRTLCQSCHARIHDM